MFILHIPGTVISTITSTWKNQDFAECRLFARAQQQKNAELNAELLN